MLTVSSGLFESYQAFVSNAVVALLPLWGAVVGIFLAFAIANMLRFFILKVAK